MLRACTHVVHMGCPVRLRVPVARPAACVRGLCPWCAAVTTPTRPAVMALPVHATWCGPTPPYRTARHRTAGYPLVNTTTFPDLKGMVDHAHDKGLKVGWYVTRQLNPLAANPVRR